MIIEFPDIMCTTLPNDIPNLKTSTELPVNHGTRVEVECEVGYSLSGSKEITCNRDKNWKYEGDSPQCIVSGGFFGKLSAANDTTYS